MTFSPALIFVAMAIGAQLASDAEPVRAGWQVVALPDGAELRYLPPHVSDADYPARARRADEQGTSLLRLQVDVSGHLTGCTVIRSAGSPDLDEQACLLYRSRARFEPRGMTQSITLHAPLTWRLEDSPTANETPKDGK
jgi:TonB family protein